MIKNLNTLNTQKEELYNSILLLTRNKSLYTKFGLSDTFQNRIYLIFIHIAFLFIKIKENNENIYKSFYQEMFDLIFNKIELNMREIGYGDMLVNKKMKYLIKVFYNILLYCENYKKDNVKSKIAFFSNYLENNNIKKSNNDLLIEYFDKYQSFCLDLSPDSVLKGELNFKYL